MGPDGVDTANYRLFGGWAVDFHAGRATRSHDDVDVAVWSADLERVRALLEAHGWVYAPEPGEDGYTGYERASIRLELAFLAQDDNGTVYTPLAHGRGEWAADSFGKNRRELAGVSARVVGLVSLVEDKSGVRADPGAAAKDRADVELLERLRGL